MENNSKKIVRALGLSSGGLDSILAALVLKNQGIEVTWISFVTPFFSSDKAEAAAGKYGIPIIVSDISEKYLVMLKNPPGGYGQNMNPCLDCHTMMFSEAGKIMREKGFDFLFSGEVAGQRPMSQTKHSLRYVEKRSGFDGYIVRPLSAKVLPLTRVEELGLVDRELLLGLNGRSRKPQMDLAREMGVSGYPSPAGGCLLTDVKFSVKLKDLMQFNPFARIEEYHLLKAGRHIRLDDKTKIIVGRDKSDNEIVMKYYDSSFDYHLRMKGIPGPVVVMTATGVESDISVMQKAAVVCASYAKTKKGDEVQVLIKRPGMGDPEVVSVTAGEASDFTSLIIS